VDLHNNNLTSLSEPILELKKIIYLDDSSYEINKLNLDCKFLLFKKISTSLKNLPLGLKEIWLKQHINIENLKKELPVGCEVKYFD
jgi:hypothetical protein